MGSSEAFMKKCLLFLLLLILSLAFACSGTEENSSSSSNSIGFSPTSSQTSSSSCLDTDTQSSLSDSSSTSSSSSNQSSLPNSSSNSSSSSKQSSSSQSSSSSSIIENTDLYAVEQALNSIVLNQNAGAGGEYTLQREFSVNDKMVTVEYSIVQGQEFCSLVGDKMFFSNPREDKRVRVKIKATCGNTAREKEVYIDIPAINNQTLIENFDVGSVDTAGGNFAGKTITAKRANTASRLSIAEYKNSKALAVTCSGEMPYGAYAGFYFNTTPNTTYKISLDLNAVGVATADLSNSDYIYLEVYQNANMGNMLNRTTLYNASGKWLSTSQKISAFLGDNGKHELIFSSDETQNGYVYFAVRVNKLVGEDLTIYIDNLHIEKCRNDIQEDFEYGKGQESEFNGKTKIKTLTASLATVNYNGEKVLKVTNQSGRQGFFAVKLNVEKNRTYTASFNCDFLGASGTNYSAGTTEGNSASVFIVANSEDLTNANARLSYIIRDGKTTTNTVLANILNINNEYKLQFTATENGYVYLIVRTNKIAEETYLYIDNLRLADITQEVYKHNSMGYLNGLGEPLKSSNVQDFDQEKVAELYGMLNVQSSRMWFGTDIFKNWSWKAPLDSFVIDNHVKEGYDKVLQLLAKEGVKEITAMGLYLPITPSTTNEQDKDEHYVPMINSTDYQLFLDKVYELWYELANAFPQITIWEVGNESNADFLKYKDYKHMSYHERSKVTADMTYYANKAIKTANPRAMVITPGFAPVTSYYTQNTNTDGQGEINLLNGINSVEIFLKYMYADIVSGNHPYHNGSKYVTEYDSDPDNYFDGLAWHPYDLGTIGYANTNDPDLDHFDVNLWVNANNACYKVMCDYGDADKGVWFTEFGIRTKETHLVYSPVSFGSPYEYCVYFAGGTVYYSQNGKTNNAVKQKLSAGNYYITFYDEINYAQMQKTILTAYYDAMKSDSMSYVHAWHYFRGFGGLKDYSWNGLAGTYCALFSESAEYLNRGFYPNHKAFILQELYGGTGDLMKYSTYASVHAGDKQVGSGLTETFDYGKVTDLSGNVVKYKGDIYAYSSNNNGAITVENGALTMVSDKNAYLGFKVNGLTQGKTYTVTFEISQSTLNTAFCIFTSDVAKGSWSTSTRIKPFGDKDEVSIKDLTVSGNKYSYTLTADQNYDSLYFTFRNNGTLVFEKIMVTVNS